jgi:ABC-2 type transport system ATP-binding protein
VAIIRDGQIVAEEAIDDLKHRHRRVAEVTFAGEPPPGLDLLPGIEVLQRDGDRVVIALEGSVNPLLRFLAGRDDVVDLLLSPPRLEDIFLGYYDRSRESGVGQSVSHLPTDRLADWPTPVGVRR